MKPELTRIAIPALLLLAASLATAADDPREPVQDAQYPEISYYRDSEDVWYTFKTDAGCLYYRSESPEIHRTNVVTSATWEGDPCTPGKYITGTGKLTEDIEAQEDRDSWTVVRTGTVEDGVFQGKMVFRSTVMTADATIMMFGGCEAEGRACRPRHRKLR